MLYAYNMHSSEFYDGVIGDYTFLTTHFPYVLEATSLKL